MSSTTTAIQEAEINGADRLAAPPAHRARSVDAAEASIGAEFDVVAERHADHPAVFSDHRSLTFRELRSWSDAIATFLAETTGSANEPCGILLPNDENVVAALIGVLKAGKIAVPLDPDYPESRLRTIIKDSGIRLLLTTRNHRPLGRGLTKGACPVRTIEEIAREGRFRIPSDVDRQTPAFIHYTSGSTGRPKGVLHSHENWLHNAFNYINFSKFAPSDRAGLLHSASFAAGICDILMTTLGGGTLLPFPIKRRGIEELGSFMHSSGMTVVNQSPSLFRQMDRVLPETTVFGKVRILITGNEPFTRNDVAVFRRRFPNACLLNRFGSSESLNSSLFYVQEDTPVTSRIVPMGWASPGKEILLRHEDGRPAENGEIGEICVRSRYISLGYWNRPDLTAERFESIGSERIYRMGDLGRIDADGCLEFIGRADFQVQIHGHRVEPAEIEEAILQDRNVGEAAVVAVSNAEDDPHLVGFFVARSGRTPLPASLKESLRATLPPYMVPQTLTRIDAMPTTPSGKLDRKTLERLAEKQGFTQDSTEEAEPEPSDEIEAVLARIWKTELRVSSLRPSDHFFDLGGNSLLTTSIIVSIRKSLGVTVTYEEFNDHPTVASLAALVRSRNPVFPKSDSVTSSSEAPKPAVSLLRAPLSPLQSRLWFLQLLNPENTAYNIYGCHIIRGRLDRDALAWSIAQVVARHDSLRTRFESSHDTAWQIVDPDLEIPLEFVDLSELGETARAEASARLDAEAGYCRFDLRKAPLIRFRLIRLTESEHRLQFFQHHIISDGWSLANIYKEIRKLYAARIDGAQECPLRPVEAQYPAYALEQHEFVRSGGLDPQLKYWVGQLKGIPDAIELPSDRPRPVDQTFTGKSQAGRIPADIAKQLKEAGIKQGLTLYMTLLAVFQLLNSRLSGSRLLTAGTPFAMRDQASLRNAVGFFMNTLVLKADLSANPTFLELLRQSRTCVLEAFENRDLPFERLVEELQPKRSLSHTPLFQVLFNLLNYEGGELELDGLETERFGSNANDSKFDVTLYAREDSEGIWLNLNYNADIFDEVRAKHMIDQFVWLATQAAAEPGKPVAEFSLIPPGAGGILPDPACPIPNSLPGDVITFLRRSVERTPDAVAVTTPDATLTYDELHRLTNRIANALISAGVEPESVVAVEGRRNIGFVIAMIGALKAGAAFAVMNPTLPEERLRHLFETAKPGAVLRTGPSKEFLIPPGMSLPPMLLDVEVPRSRETLETTPQLTSISEADPRIEIRPDQLAYVGFTSGTTGLPKGILGDHGPLGHFIDWQRTTFGFTPKDRFSMLSGLAYDAVMRDIFAPLACGGTLSIPSDDILESPGALAGWLRNSEITTVHATPSMIRVLAHRVASEGDEKLGIRTWFSGGDVLKPADIATLRSIAPEAKIVNFFGTTETPQGVSCYEVSEADAERVAISIGRGIEGVQMLVLNESGGLAGIGEPGEICVRSPHLARGYAGDSENGRFLVNPFTGLSGDRVYRTGDIGRYRPDGNVEFAGRADRQVKIRGFRIEPAEVESNARKHPDLSEAVVTAFPHEGDNALACYYVKKAGAEVSGEQIREFLSKRLPTFAVPGFYVALDSLPLNANRKVDHARLPCATEAADRMGIGNQARNLAEEWMIQIWTDILNRDDIGATENFFDLGGHSLLALRMFTQIRKTFDVELPVKSLFEAPTVRGLTHRIEEVKRNRGQDPHDGHRFISPIQPRGSKTPVFLCPGGSGSEAELLVFARLSRHLGSDQPVFGLRAIGVDGQAMMHASVEDMTADYADEIIALQPDGPYRLIGECLGANAAFELARQLTSRGREVESLVLLDPFFPNDGSLRAFKKRLRNEWWRKQTVDRFQHHMHLIREKGVAGWLRRVIAKLLGRTIESDPANQGPIVEFSESEAEAVRNHSYRRVIYKYRPQPWSGRTTLVMSGMFAALPDSERWRRLQGLTKADDVIVEGDHFSYIRDHADSTADALKELLGSVDEESKA